MTALATERHFGAAAASQKLQEAAAAVRTAAGELALQDAAAIAAMFATMTIVVDATAFAPAAMDVGVLFGRSFAHLWPRRHALGLALLLLPLAALAAAFAPRL